MKFEYFVYYSLEQQMEYSSKHEQKKKQGDETLVYLKYHKYWIESS